MSMAKPGGGEEESSWWGLMMIETAEEELQTLEANHPNRFGWLKDELRSFISLHRRHPHHRPATSAATQASTSGMKRKRGGLVGEKMGTRKKSMEDERVEMAMKRAKACLRKIQEFKTQLLVCSH